MQGDAPQDEQEQHQGDPQRNFGLLNPKEEENRRDVDPDGHPTDFKEGVGSKHQKRV